MTITTTAMTIAILWNIIVILLQDVSLVSTTRHTYHRELIKPGTYTMYVAEIPPQVCTGYENMCSCYCCQLPSPTPSDFEE